jgi:hypothetical protein
VDETALVATSHVSSSDEAVDDEVSASVVRLFSDMTVLSVSSLTATVVVAASVVSLVSG